MPSQHILDPIQQNVVVALPIEAAFERFVSDFNEWWPPEYTWSGDVLAEIAIEPRVDGRCFERGPHGFVCDGGRGLVYAPPQRIAFTWQISPTRVPEPNPAKVSQIEVRFTAEAAAQTRLTLIHRDFERHGEGAAEYRAMLATSQGWPYILDCFVQAVQG